MVQLTGSKLSLSGITRERVVLKMEKLIEASKVMLWIEATIECKAECTAMKILERSVEDSNNSQTLSQEEALQMQSMLCNKCRRNAKQYTNRCIWPSWT